PERPGADRRPAAVEIRRGGIDEAPLDDMHLYQVERQRKVRLEGLDANAVPVDGLHIPDDSEDLIVVEPASLDPPQAFPAREHIVCIKEPPVLKQHAALQFAIPMYVDD